MAELGGDGQAVENQRLYILKDVSAADAGENASQRAGVEAVENRQVSMGAPLCDFSAVPAAAVLRPSMRPPGRGRNSLIFGQILVKLEVAPDFTATVDAINVELRGSNLGEVEMSEYAGCVVYEISEASACGCEAQTIMGGEVRSCVGEDERIPEEAEECCGRVVVKRVGVVDVLEHVTANARDGGKQER